MRRRSCSTRNSKRLTTQFLRLLVASLAIASATAAAPAGAQETYVRVVDVGAGLCVVAMTPDGHSLVYDTGNGVATCLSAVRELVPAKKVDLLVLSHSDSDHIGAV